MAFQGERKFFIDEIAALQRQQLNMNQDASLQGWTPEQSALAFDTRFARIASLMRDLTRLDEDKIEP